MIISKLSGWFRLLIILSAVWIVGVLIHADPWYRIETQCEDSTEEWHGIVTRSASLSEEKDVKKYSYNNWDDFFRFGVLPVIVLWGILWIVHGFVGTVNLKIPFKNVIKKI